MTKTESYSKLLDQALAADKAETEGLDDETPNDSRPTTQARVRARLPGGPHGDQLRAFG